MPALPSILQVCSQLASAAHIYLSDHHAGILSLTCILCTREIGDAAGMVENVVAVAD